MIRMTLAHEGYRVQRRTDFFPQEAESVTLLSARNDFAAASLFVQADEDLMIVTSKGIVTRQTVRGISTQKRYSRGVILMNVDKDDYVTAVETFKQEAEEEKQEEAGDILTEN